MEKTIKNSTSIQDNVLVGNGETSENSKCVDEEVVVEDNKKTKKNKPIKKGKSVVNKVFIGVIFTILIAYAVSIIFVLLWGLNTSLKYDLDFDSIGNKNVMGLPTLDATNKFNSREAFFGLANYKTVFANLTTKTYGSYYSRGVLMPNGGMITTQFAGLIINSLIYCFLGAFLLTLSPVIVSFMCAKYKKRMSKIIYAFVVLSMTIPLVGTTPSELNFVRDLGIYSTWLQHVFQSFCFANMYFLVLYAFFVDLSDTYIEAAEIDGASQLRTFLTIVIPLARNIMFSIFLLNFITYWNNYEANMLFFPTHPTLTYAVLLNVKNSQRGMGHVTVKTASCMLLAAPLVLVFSIFHKRLMGNLSLGGIKE